MLRTLIASLFALLLVALPVAGIAGSARAQASESQSDGGDDAAAGALSADTAQADSLTRGFLKLASLRHDEAAHAARSLLQVGGANQPHADAWTILVLVFAIALMHECAHSFWRLLGRALKRGSLAAVRLLRRLWAALHRLMNWLRKEWRAACRRWRRRSQP